LIACFIGNTSAKSIKNNPFTYVKVVASQRWDVFETRCSYAVQLTRGDVKRP